MAAVIVNFRAAQHAVEQLARLGTPRHRAHVVAAVVAENRAGRNGMAVGGALQQLAAQQAARPHGRAR